MRFAHPTALLRAGSIVVARQGAKISSGSYSDYRSAQRTQTVLALAVAAGNLTHTLQIERGAPAGFLQSKGAKFADGLPGIRSKTDEQRAAFNAEAAKIDLAAMPALADVLKQAQGQLETLANLRQRAGAQQIAVPEHVSAYTGIIARLIGIVASGGHFNSDATMGQQLLSYLFFVQAKEQAGQERALSTAAFSADQIEPVLYRQILERHFRQEAYLDGYRSTAGKSETEALDKVLSGTAAKEVQAMRDVLYEKAAESGPKVDPQLWFKTITEKIDAMLGVEQLVARNIGERAEGIVTNERNILLASIALTVLAMIVMLGVAAWVSVSVSRPLKESVQVAEHAIRENDFSRSVPEAGPAEVVRAGRAFNELKREFREIIADVKQSSERIADCVFAISSALNELDAAIREVAQNVERIARMTEVNNQAAESNYTTARSLDSLSAQLRESVVKYKT